MDDEQLQKILEDYQKELQDLYDRRAKRAEERSKMTDEELLDSMVKDLEEVADAIRKEHEEPEDENEENE